MKKDSLLRGLAFLASFFPHLAFGLTNCYTEVDFPAATRVQPLEDGGMQVTLGGRNADAEGFAPVVLFGADETWTDTGERACSHWRCKPGQKREEPACMAAITRHREGARPASCTEHEGFYYFGLTAYRGEGSRDRGAIGRLDLESGELELRELPILRDKTVSHIVHDGKGLWFATERSEECSGAMPGAPLQRYFWDEDRLLPVGAEVRGTHGGYCGFRVNDLAMQGDALWLATDMGITRIVPVPPPWGAVYASTFLGSDHYATPSAREAVPQEIGCEQLYRGLFVSVSEHPTTGADNFTPYDLLFMNLAEHRTGLLQEIHLEHTRRKPADALWTALRDGNHQQARELLRSGVAPNWQTSEGKSPLQLAIEHEDLQALQVLHLAGLQHRLSLGWSPLEVAEKLKKAKSLEWLREHMSLE